MMANDHRACVDAWLERGGKGASPEQLVQRCEEILAALLRRADRALGAVTLTAILERVVASVVGRFPFLSALEIEAAGIRCRRLRDHAAAVDHEQLVEGVRSLLVEFLTVLGDLTAEILSPALHRELARRSPAERPARADAAGSLDRSREASMHRGSQPR